MTGGAGEGQRVRAVIPAGAAAIERAVADQERPADAVVTVRSVVRDAPRSASGATWLWLLDGSAVPRPDTLARLLEALGELEPLPTPALLLAKVAGPDGRLAPDHPAWYRRGRTELALLAAERRVVPIRAARAGCVLVRADAVAAAPALPGLEGAGAALEWSFRLLRAEVGYLVPRSVALAATDAHWPAGALGRDPAEDVRIGVATLLGGGLVPRERLWLASELAGRTLPALRERRASPGVLFKATRAGARAVRAGRNP